MASSGSRAGSLRMDVAVLSWRSVLSTTGRQKMLKKKSKNRTLYLWRLVEAGQDTFQWVQSILSGYRFMKLKATEQLGDMTVSALLTAEVQLTAQPSGSGPYNGILKYTSTCSRTCRLPGDVKHVPKPTGGDITSKHNLWPVGQSEAPRKVGRAHYWKRWHSARKSDNAVELLFFHKKTQTQRMLSNWQDEQK